MPDEMTFGGWLRQRRRMLDLTQQQLADQVGCARITLRRIETGALKPSRELAQILLEKVGLPEPERVEWVRFARGLSIFPQKKIQEFVPQPRPTNLPVALTSFIGREKEQDEVIHLLAKNRLVTLLGAGGIGKTRLALQVGQELMNDYSNGVWFVVLDSLSDPALIPQTVASVFDIRESRDRPIIEILINVLREKTTLLILDNCEHLLEACTQLITTLLQNCPSLKILAASREVLSVPGEAVYYLPSLSIPEDGTSLEEFTEYESIQLFMQRAALALSLFRLTKENAQIIIDICRKVDGIPLAIELAAAYINILQPEQILKQLNESFSWLASDSRVILSRHQTMRASMDWSWSLLSKSEQIFLRQLSVFAGGWTLESAQTVCEGNTLNLISTLAKKSLILVNQKSEGETRYGFHEIVRQYAREKLVQAGEEENIRTRHLNYFLQFSEQAESGLRGPAQIEWYARWNEERDNVRVALEWADKTDMEAGLYLSSRLHRVWERDFREGNHWLPKFLQKRESHAYPRARAKALEAHIWILDALEEFDEAHSSAQECLDLYRALGDQQGEVDALLWLSWEASKPAEKLALIQQALGLANALGDVRRQADALTHLGWLNQGSRFAHWKKAIDLTHQLGDWLRLANMLSTMGWFLILDGDIEAAQKCLEEAGALYQRLNRKSSGTKLLAPYGQIALIQGDFEKARAYFQESATINREFGNRMDYLWDRVHLGYIALRESNLNEARDIFGETVQDFQKDKNTGGVVFTLEGIANLYLATNKPTMAARLIGWADATREKFEDTRPLLEQADVDKIIAACMAKIGESAFSDAYAAGQKMSLDEAVAYALKEN